MAKSVNPAVIAKIEPRATVINIATAPIKTTNLSKICLINRCMLD